MAGYFVAQEEQFPDLRLRSLETPGREKTSMDWEIEASGLTSLLIRVREEYTTLPIYITENGAAFDDYVDPNGDVKDHNRVAYLQEHISAVHDAIDAGVNVEGYFVWSLLDNFEWALGYSRRFGIVWVDFPSGDSPEEGELRVVSRHDPLQLGRVRHVGRKPVTIARRSPSPSANNRRPRKWPAVPSLGATRPSAAAKFAPRSSGHANHQHETPGDWRTRRPRTPRTPWCSRGSWRY